ncbi:hypothetical protein AN958_00217 [Leucoagaricus sp. SymC.cos]|nr:hypothetical protein AN958_00217 [Leucoagaricus sp. SymC.cos]
MSSRYEPRGLLNLTLVKSQVRYSTLAEQYRTAPAPNIPSTPSVPSHHSVPWAASSDWIPGGLIDLQGHGASRVVISSNPYAGREFPTEKYEQVKRDVDYMREHPYEETLRYKVRPPQLITRVPSQGLIRVTL